MNRGRVSFSMQHLRGRAFDENPTRSRTRRLTELGSVLDRLYDDFNHGSPVPDPVHVVRRFERLDDREIVAFVAAALAFGRVASIQSSIEALLALMGERPAAFVRTFEPSAHRRRMRHLGHRWIRAHDVMALVWILRQMLRRSGSVEAFFAEGHRADAVDVGPALDSFSARACDLDLDAVYGSLAGVRRAG